MPSPQRSHKSIRDIINDERDSRPSQKPVRKLPAKKRVKDRLGTKPAAITEIFLAASFFTDFSLGRESLSSLMMSRILL